MYGCRRVSSGAAFRGGLGGAARLSFRVCGTGRGLPRTPTPCTRVTGTVGVVVVCVSVRGGRSWRSRWCRPSIVSCVFIRSPAGPSTSGSGQCGLLPLGDVSVSGPGRSAVAGLCVFVPNEPMDYNG